MRAALRLAVPRRRVYCPGAAAHASFAAVVALAQRRALVGGAIRAPHSAPPGPADGSPACAARSLARTRCNGTPRHHLPHGPAHAWRVARSKWRRGQRAVCAVCAVPCPHGPACARPRPACAGLLFALTDLLSRHGLNIDSMQSDRHTMSGKTMFTFHGMLTAAERPDMAVLQHGVKQLESRHGVLCEVRDALTPSQLRRSITRQAAQKPPVPSA